MPTYEYACRSCEQRLEVVQSFADDALTVCEACGGELRKVFSAAGLIFKGSGWHIKDYSSSGTSTSASSTGSASGSSSGSSSGKGDAAPSPATKSTASEPKSTTTASTSGD